MVQHLAGKIAVVTGAGRGMGRAFAQRLAKDGADIVALDIEQPDATVGDITALGRRALALTLDVSSADAVAAAAATVLRSWGPAHILINNAGLHPHPMPFEALSFEYWRKTMSVNLDAMFLTIQAFLPQLKSNGWGRIINLSSSAYNAAPPNGAPYLASKGGVVGLTRAAASEFGKYHITVNAIAPNPVRTPGAEQGPMSEEMFEAIAAQQPISRVLVPADIAGIVSFLCSDDAEVITGQHYHVDGGAIRGD